MNESIAGLRQEYKQAALLESNLNHHPLQFFATWWQQAIEASIHEPNAMTLCTVDAVQQPHARIVLLKDFSEEKGFTFFTNYASAKGEQLLQNNKVALLFFWKELERQIRIEGLVQKISKEESEQYFASRPLGSQLGAIASNQSTIIDNREVLEKKYSELEQQYSTDTPPMPEHWGGYVVKPHLMEFWQGRSSRLHDRLQYTLVENEWHRVRLAP